MATQTRLVMATQVAVIDDTAPVPWSPPAFAARPALPPLPMQIASKPSGRQQRAQADVSRYAPEPGMVFIGAGEFSMGDDDGNPDAAPRRPVLLNTYWIDRYPVTNAEYKNFVDATGHRPPASWAGGACPSDRANHPVTHVTWRDVAAYAAWAGKRLPTEAEWEKAARSTHRWRYPWGGTFRKDLANACNDHGGTTPVDAFPGGASPYGVMDMCGNVREWCADWYDEAYYKTGPVDNPTGPDSGQYKVCRGGSYADDPAGVRASARYYALPDTPQAHIGFRCAKTPVLPDQKPAEPEAPPPQLARRPEPSEAMSLEQLAQDYPERVARVLCALLRESESDPSSHSAVAALVIGLGQATGAEVLKYCSDADVEHIARIVMACDRISPQHRQQAFEMVKQRILSGDYALQGGLDFVRGLVEHALGANKAQALINRITGGDAYLLRNVDPGQIALFIAREHPQTIAVILSQLDPAQAAGVLNSLAEDLQTDVAHRMARLETISPQTLRDLEEGLTEELRAILTGQIAAIGGPKCVAEVLKRVSRSTEKAVFEAIGKDTPTLAETIRNHMFAFHDIARLTDREIQAILKEVDTKDLAIALKTSSPALQERIFGNVSEKAGAEIREEMQHSGPVRISDIAETQLRIVQIARDLEARGEIAIVRGDTADEFV